MSVDKRDRRLIRHFMLAKQDALLPLLYNIYIQELMKKQWNSTDEAKVGGQLVNATRFADDQAMVATSIAGLHILMNMLIHQEDRPMICK